MKSEKLARHYQGSAARSYDADRTNVPKWHKEQELLAQIFAQLPDGMEVIDVPVGTGRLFDFYADKNARVTGIDISADMLAEASQHPSQASISATLAEGSVLSLEFPPDSFDLSICIRLLNLMETASMRTAIRELARVSRRYVVAGVRHVIPADRNPAGLLRRLSQMRRRAKRHRQGKIHFHSEADVLDAFASAGLTIARQDRVEQRKDGTEYNIYLLNKNG